MTLGYISFIFHFKIRYKTQKHKEKDDDYDFIKIKNLHKAKNIENIYYCIHIKQKKTSHMAENIGHRDHKECPEYLRTTNKQKKRQRA